MWSFPDLVSEGTGVDPLGGLGDLPEHQRAVLQHLHIPQRADEDKLGPRLIAAVLPLLPPPT